MVCTPIAFAPRRSRATNAGCISGSPPEIVRPPPVAANTVRYRATRARISSAVTSVPRRICIVSGLWQYRHCSGQPARNTVSRVPGPSTAVTSSQECTDPSDPDRTAAIFAAWSSSTDDETGRAGPGPGQTQVHGSATEPARAPGWSWCRHAFGQTEPWNVRDSTSSCCSRVSRTKFTA